MILNWEHFDHQADIGVRGFGRTLEEALENAAVAMTAVITDPRAVQTAEAVRIRCAAADRDLLLVEWLNALIYEMADRTMLFGRFKVRLDDAGLEAEAWGEKLDVRRHLPAVEVKAATYAELKVEQTPDGTWLAQCVVDV